MRGALAIALACLAMLHAPDGSLIAIDIHHIGLLRPGENVKQHVAHGTNTIISVDGKNIGIMETVEQAQYAIHHCVDGGER